MEVFYSTHEAGRRAPNSVVAIGKFDGMHRGHNHLMGLVLERARSLRAKSLVLTFDPHPQAFFNPDSFRPLLTLERKLQLIGGLGVDAAVVLPFDKALVCMAAEAFVKDVLVNQLRAADVWVGEDFCFGKDRAGRVDNLEALGREHGFGVHPVPLMRDGGEPITAARIRGLINAGRREEAAALLGRPLEE